MTSEVREFAHGRITRGAGGVYTLQIQGIKGLNVLSTPVIDGLTQACRWLATQPDARVVVLRGTDDERAFVGGANIFEMAELDPAGARSFITGLRELCESVRDIPVPTLARISGLCLGGGLELAAACDIRLGAEGAVFGMPEVRLGIPSVIHAVLLPALIGSGATNWLLLTGENIDAEQARQWGFLQFTAPIAQLDALVEQTVAAILANGPRALQAQKSLLRHWESDTILAGLDRSVDAFAAAFQTTEPRDSMAPFLARRRQS